MRSFRKFALVGALSIGAFVAAALAAETVRSVLVSPETGEVSTSQRSVFNVARLKLGHGTGTASSNAVTINAASGVITTETLTTAGGSTQAITLTSNKIQAGDMVFATADPVAGAGTPSVANIVVSASTAVILLKNIHASAALDAAVKIYFVVLTKGNTGN